MPEVTIRHTGPMPDLMSLAETQAHAPLVELGEQELKQFGFGTRIKSINLDPSKSRLYEMYTPGDTGQNQYLVEEDHVLVGQLEDGESFSSLIGTCMGVYAKGTIDGKPGVMLAHIDVDVPEKQLEAKVRRVKNWMGEFMQTQEAYIDLSPYTPEKKEQTIRRILDHPKIPKPEDSQERVVIVNNTGIGMLTRHDGPDQKTQTHWKK